MVSYQTWKVINESILGFGSMTLGLGKMHSVNNLGEKRMSDEPDVDMELEPEDWGSEKDAPKSKKSGKKSGKCCAKKMCGKPDCPADMDKKHCGKKQSKKMKNEEVSESEWLESVKNQLGFDPTRKASPGLMEDMFSVAGMTDDDGNMKHKKKKKVPGPGEVGFAPQGRMGAW